MFFINPRNVSETVKDTRALSRPVDAEVQGSRAAALVEGLEQVDGRVEVVGLCDIQCKIVSDRGVL